ncbi:hypothetical protein LOTGIDRAFT_229416 [Lottia gigantea]|uniref:Arrestin C-terminal-like domain-containing protein n=1 Tax=Lottia gigantea TaxID=225164 RepID=V3ZWT2_LOTGI|nr:hypothetical protein LOTGIDRAFT_229416 [Lottia gigantea]ESO85391.1 hypothetical protein LOTGIDRAFT_229416 [Lottia gigantea]
MQASGIVLAPNFPRHFKIRIECNGTAHVHWVDTRNSEGAVAPESADEQYYNCYQLLYPLPATESEAQTEMPSESAVIREDKLRILEAGSHSFPFEFPIPPKLPCSFEGPYGHVRYWLRAVIEKHWKLKVNVRPFKITPKLDLNNVPHSNEEITISKSFPLSTFLQQSASVFASVNLPKKGYVLGETIPVNIYIKNDSNKNLWATSLKLKMNLHYETPSQSRNTKINLSKVKLGKVLAGETIERVGNLSIPNDLPPNLNGCGLINVKYSIMLKIKPSLFSLSTFKTAVDIVIGTIPFRSIPSSHSMVFSLPPSYGEIMNTTDLPSYYDIVTIES